MQREIWLGQLAEFIIEANKETYAAGKGEVKPLLPGHKTLMYARDPKKFPNDPWKLVDDYSGSFRAPGLTIVSYKDSPAWQMSYGGRGMVEGHYNHAEAVFDFLKEALMLVPADLPLRGLDGYKRGIWCYTIKVKGDLEECTWEEKVVRNRRVVFTQTGGAGIYIHRTPDRKPLYPWNL